MANMMLVEMLRRSVKEFNDWRKANPRAYVDLQGADLKNLDLSWVDFSAHAREVNLRYANFTGSNLQYANLLRADCAGATFRNADLSWVNFRKAILTYCDLGGANCRVSDFKGTDLRSAILEGVDFTKAYGTPIME